MFCALKTMILLLAIELIVDLHPMNDTVWMVVMNLMHNLMRSIRWMLQSSWETTSISVRIAGWALLLQLNTVERLMWNLSRSSKTELVVKEVWLLILERLLIGVSVVICDVFEVFIVKTIQDWLIAVWVIDHLQVDHRRLFGAITHEFPLRMELLSNLDTCIHWLMDTPLSCVVVLVVYKLGSIRTWWSWHHCSPHNGSWLVIDLSILALFLQGIWLHWSWTTSAPSTVRALLCLSSFLNFLGCLKIVYVLFRRICFTTFAAFAVCSRPLTIEILLLLHIGLDDKTLLIAGHWIEVTDLDIMAVAITPAQASGTINYCPAGCLCAPMIPWDRTGSNVTARQYVVNSKSEILE